MAAPGCKPNRDSNGEEHTPIEMLTARSVVTCCHRISRLDGVSIDPKVIKYVEDQVRAAISEVCIGVMQEFQEITEPIRKTKGVSL